MENNTQTQEQKLDRVLELLEKQESRAKWGTFWKFFWIFLLVILPMYMSYKIISSFDFSAITNMMDSAQSLQGLDTSAISDALKMLQK